MEIGNTIESQAMIDPRFRSYVTSADQLEELIGGKPIQMIQDVKQAKLDTHARAFLQLSPFALIGTHDSGGKADVSPRGDPPGFVRVRAGYWNSLLLPLMVAQRKLLASNAAASDVAPFPPWLDAMLHAITEIERRLPFRLPAGGSVLATAERP